MNPCFCNIYLGNLSNWILKGGCFLINVAWSGYNTFLHHLNTAY